CVVAQYLEKEPFKGKRIIVFSHQKQKSGEHSKWTGNPVAFTKKLRKTRGKGIWLVGGGEMVSVFLQHGLVDEMRLFVHPVVIGKGIPLFGRGATKTKLRLEQTRKFPSGLVELRYKTV
ncbi:MAG: dihydrofolate reductase family protein, partial [Candidatus Diapherotrites archaeon]|nr:dihydrofolate reductase family protein [Candidatus Diapherotrites archaeon]